MNKLDRGRDDAAPRSGTPHDLVGAYVLNAVDDRERAQFEEHLTGCPACRREVADLSETVEQLSVGLEQAPPAGLRARLLAQVADEPQDAPAGAGRSSEPGGRQAAGADELAGRRSRRAARRGRGWLAGIAAAAVVVVGTVTVTQWPEGSQEQVVVAVADVLEAPDAVRSSETLGSSTVTVVTSASLARSVLVAEDLEAAPEGRDYQLWFVGEDGTAVSAGLVPGEPSESTSLLLEGDPAGAAAVGITVEPAGGSEQPTSDPIVAVPLQG